MYRIRSVRQAVKFLLHFLQDLCGGAVLWFAVINLVQDGVENLTTKNNRTYLNAIKSQMIKKRNTSVISTI